MKTSFLQLSHLPKILHLLLGLCLLPMAQLAQEVSGGSSFRRSNDELIVVNRTELIHPDEVVRNAVVVGGDIQVDGRIERDLVVVGGSVTLNGEIGGDLILIGGKLITGPDALVERGGILIGGPFEIASRGTFDDDLFQFPLPGLFSFLSGIKLWIGHCVFLMRPFAPAIAWTMVLAALLSLVNFLTLILLGSVVDHSVKVLIPKPITTFFVGLLGLILMGPLLVLVTATGVGLLMIPFVICAFVAAVIVGKVAVYASLGQRIGQRAGLQWENASVPAFLVGSLLMFLFYLVPFIGGLALGVVIPLAFGSVLMAGIQMFRNEVDFPTPKPGKPLVMRPPNAGSDTKSSKAVPYSDSETVGKKDKADADSKATVEEESHQPTSGTPQGSASHFQSSERRQDGHFERAGFWARGAATTLDFVLVFVGLQILNLIDGHGGFRRFVFLWMVYHMVLWGWKGTTVGGVIMKLRLVSINGDQPSWGTVVIRSLSSLFSFIALGLGFLWVGWNAERQSWHDMVAGTVIIKTPHAEPAFA
jgi:uncharacterized RDD family membrane protein YckC